MAFRFKEYKCKMFQIAFTERTGHWLKSQGMEISSRTKHSGPIAYVPSFE
jgi:hypothetical protein